MPEMKKMPYSTYERLHRVRCAAKSGSRELTAEEHKFCRDMYLQYTTLYGLMEARVFNETVPFGSDVHRDEPPVDEYVEYSG